MTITINLLRFISFSSVLFLFHKNISSYYIVVVFIDPLQGLYAILFGDTVDWFDSPTT